MKIFKVNVVALSTLYVLSIFIALFTFSAQPVGAIDNGCPAGQKPGISNVSGRPNPNKCYAECNTTEVATIEVNCTEQGDVKKSPDKDIKCPPTTTRGNITDNNKNNDDRNKCYVCQTQGEVKGMCTDYEFPDDGKKCPEGLYRGILRDQDPSKCYRCDANGCQDANQGVVSNSVDACENTNRDCIERQRREHEQYIQSIRDGAPAGFTVPGPNDTINGSRNAQLFCNYYKAPEETRIDTNYVYRACIIGYEVGYGRGNICSELYLFGANATHKDFPNSHAKRFRAYVNTLDNETKKLLISQSIAACEDGWNQYRVDYWYCNGNQGCQRALRQDASRVIDPGPAPTREIINGSNSPTPAGIVFQTGTPTQTCGSIQTAYFSCGGGGNDIQTSSFWQILEIILNILIGMVAIGAVGGLVFGAVKYSSAGDNATQVSDAKNIIKNVIIGLVLFLSMWAIIQYFIPGGIL